MRVGPKRRLSTQELMLFNCAVWKGSWQSLVLQGDPTSPNQSIRDKTSSEHSLERLTLALKFQYFGHWIRRAYSLEKTLILGKVEVGSRREWQRMRCLDGITNSMNVSWVSARRWWRTGKPGVLWSLGPRRIRHHWATEQQQGQVMRVPAAVQNSRAKDWKG